MAKLQAYYSAGVNHFLFVSGDYPERSNKTPQKPFSDIDSVQMFMLLAAFREKDHIAKGCAVSPFKTFESEQIWQYEKLRRKISVGADFVVTQLGFDIRKFDELIRFCRLHNISAPLLANIRITDRQTARLIEARGIPGVKIESRLLNALHQETSGRHGQIGRTAKTLAVIKGLGFHGALIGNYATDFSEIKQVLDKAETLQPDWQSFLQELNFSGHEPSFYYFQKDPENGLNSNEPAPVALKHFPSPTYSFSYFVDWLVYVPQGPLFKLTGRFCFFCHTRKFWYGFLWLLEYISKGILYGCNMCGDCTLYACGFLCYQSGCPKKMVNGPCGGSIEGYCEVYPEKKRCYWVKVYHNMKGVRQHVTFVAPPIPARDASLQRTSSWINFFLGKDHRKMKFEDL
jgi:methylenetetrahydrofolate reductase (NADPH)